MKRALVTVGHVKSTLATRPPQQNSTLRKDFNVVGNITTMNETAKNEPTESSVSTPQVASAQNPYIMPIAIVIAGVCIAAAIFATSGSAAPRAPSQGGLITADVLPVTKDDHVYGSRDAEVFLIEYSDYRCGFCARFHDTVKEVLDVYDGRVAWVYRHTPYQPGGMEAAVASECIAKFAGEDAFWEYTDDALQNTSNLSEEWHKAKAEALGVDAAEFAECYKSNEFDERIATYMNNSAELGGRGTPFSVILTQDGNYLTVPGAVPLESVMLQMERAFKTL